MAKIGIISQARMTSTRLPGKVMKKINERTLLDYHCDRLSQSGLPLILAITENSSDDVLEKFARAKKISIFRGSESDVLSRFYGAALEQKLDIVIRVTSDCPLIDGKLIAQAARDYASQKSSWLYMSNVIERTFARGFDFEIFSFEMLKEAFEKATSFSEREHVTPYIHQNKHGKTIFKHIKRDPDLHKFRLTVDEADDFKLIEKLILEFNCAEESESEISLVLQQNPELLEINEHIEQKKI